MNERLTRIIRKYSIILAIGIAYLIWVLLTDLRIPCIFNLIFKLKCPGCGITRMLAAIARFDLKSAFLFNPFVFITLPIIAFLIIYPEVRYVNYGRYTLGKFKIVAWCELILALLFGILRNIG